MERPGLSIALGIVIFFLIALLLMPGKAGSAFVDRFKNKSEVISAGNVIISFIEKDKDGKVIKTSQAPLTDVLEELNGVLIDINKRLQILEAKTNIVPGNP